MSQIGEQVAIVFYIDQREPMEVPCSFVCEGSYVTVPNSIERMFCRMLAVEGQTVEMAATDHLHHLAIGKEVPLSDGTLAIIRGVWCNSDLRDKYDNIPGTENLFASALMTHIAQEEGVRAKGEAYTVKGRLLLFVERTEETAHLKDYLAAFNDVSKTTAETIEKAILEQLNRMLDLDDDPLELEALGDRLRDLATPEDAHRFLEDIEKKIREDME